jgi:hypothetical protein
MDYAIFAQVCEIYSSKPGFPALTPHLWPQQRAQIRADVGQLGKPFLQDKNTPGRKDDIMEALVVTVEEWSDGAGYFQLPAIEPAQAITKP